MDKEFIYEFIVRESMLDTMGHLNHAAYLVLYEEARWDLCAEQGMTIERIQARGVGLVVIEANIFYRQEIRARERLRIRTQFFHHDKKIWKAKQSMERSNGEICSRLELKACVFDLQKRCILAADPEWQAVFRGEFAVQNP